MREAIVMKFNAEFFTNQFQQMLSVYAPKVVGAFIVLIVGFWLSSRLSSIIKNLVLKRSGEAILGAFIGSIAGVGLKACVLVSAVSMLGVATSSFVAIFGAAGLAIGLALQGSLSNFAGGMLIILFKPFKKGDYIKGAGDAEGNVEDIQIFQTVLRSADNKRVFVPNATLSNSTIVNFSAEGTRRVSFIFGIGYDDDLIKAKDLLRKIAENCPYVIDHDEKTVVGVESHGDNSVNFQVHIWVKSENYWPACYYMPEKVKLSFDEAGISIPYPQLNLHFPKSMKSLKCDSTVL